MHACMGSSEEPIANDRWIQAGTHIKHVQLFFFFLPGKHVQLFVGTLYMDPYYLHGDGIHLLLLVNLSSSWPCCVAFACVSRVFRPRSEQICAPLFQSVAEDFKLLPTPAWWEKKLLRVQPTRTPSVHVHIGYRQTRTYNL